MVDKIARNLSIRTIESYSHKDTGFRLEMFANGKLGLCTVRYLPDGKVREVEVAYFDMSEIELAYDMFKERVIAYRDKLI
jgi:hypothetical protein